MPLTVMMKLIPYYLVKLEVTRLCNPDAQNCPKIAVYQNHSTIINSLNKNFKNI